MANSLMDRMLKTEKNKTSNILSKSSFFKREEVITTDIPILNVAFSGELDGGLVPGLTIFAGPSKSFKTMLGLYCMKAYLDKHPEGIAILYDTEFGITPEYLETFDIDTNRVLHIPTLNIEELKFNIMNKLEQFEASDKVFILIDSIGNIASKKEVDDALAEKSVADMSRAKQLKSLFRMITPHLTIKKIPCIAINHIYSEQGLYPKDIVSGGTGLYYSASTIFIIKKAQEKEDGEISGWKFTINIEKSRFVREKAKLPFYVYYDRGIEKLSHLFDLALENKNVIKANQGWYNTVDFETGEVIEPKKRAKDIQSDIQFFRDLTRNNDFKEFVMSKYMLNHREKEHESREENNLELDTE